MCFDQRDNRFEACVLRRNNLLARDPEVLVPCRLHDSYRRENADECLVSQTSFSSAILGPLIAP